MKSASLMKTRTGRYRVRVNFSEETILSTALTESTEKGMEAAILDAIPQVPQFQPA